MTEKTHTNDTTDKQAAANRANAKRSTGPRTPQGKKISARNALRNGLYAKHPTAIPVGVFSENEDDVEAYLAGIVESLAPRDDIECDQARRVAHARLRAVRFEACETYAMTSDGLTDKMVGRHQHRLARGNMWLSRALKEALEDPEGDHYFGVLAHYLMQRQREQDERHRRPLSIEELLHLKRDAQPPDLDELDELDAAQWREKFFHLVDHFWPNDRTGALLWAEDLFERDVRVADKLEFWDERVAAFTIMRGSMATATLLDARIARALDRAEANYERLQKRHLE